MKTINDKIYDYLNAQFRVKLPETLTDLFGDRGFTTEWNIFAGSFGGLTTSWKKKVSPKKAKEIRAYISTYEKGFTDAMNLVYYFKK